VVQVLNELSLSESSRRCSVKKMRGRRKDGFENAALELVGGGWMPHAY